MPLNIKLIVFDAKWILWTSLQSQLNHHTRKIAQNRCCIECKMKKEHIVINFIHQFVLKMWINLMESIENKAFSIHAIVSNAIIVRGSTGELRGKCNCSLFVIYLNGNGEYLTFSYNHKMIKGRSEWKEEIINLFPWFFCRHWFICLLEMRTNCTAVDFESNASND